MAEPGFDFRVMQDGMEVASAYAASRADALKEARHYALVYGQDGPVEVQEKVFRPNSGRWKWTPVVEPAQ